MRVADVGTIAGSDRRYSGIPALNVRGLALLAEGLAGRIPDGDGLELLWGCEARQLRLAGVDAAEMGARDQLTRAEAQNAKQTLERLVRGERLAAYADPLQEGPDRWGRWRVYLLVQGSWLDVNRRMLELGAAEAWRGGRYARRREFAAVERAARALGVRWSRHPDRGTVREGRKIVFQGSEDYAGTTPAAQGHGAGNSAAPNPKDWGAV